MFYCEVPANEHIFKQGDSASSFFILEQGSLEVVVNNKLVRELKSGDGFGELALLYSAPRSASIKCNGPCRLWGIDRHTFRKAVEELITKEYEENRKFIDAVKFFRKILNAYNFSNGMIRYHDKQSKGCRSKCPHQSEIRQRPDNCE